MSSRMARTLDIIMNISRINGIVASIVSGNKIKLDPTLTDEQLDKYFLELQNHNIEYRFCQIEKSLHVK